MAGLLEKPCFFGIEDGFLNMDEATIKRATILAEDSLLAKGYASMNFEGVFTLYPTLVQHLLTCIDSQRFLKIRLLHNGVKSLETSVYCKDGNLVSLDVVKKGAYTMEATTVEQLTQRVFDCLHWVDSAPIPVSDTPISMKKLSHVAKTADFSSGEQLRRLCGQEGVANVLAGGLLGLSNCYSLLFLDFTKPQLSPEQFLGINSGAGAIQLKACHPQGTCTLHALERSTLTDYIHGALSQLATGGIDCD